MRSSTRTLKSNPEKDWGLFTRQAIEFALWAINEQLAATVPGTSNKQRQFLASNTLVIASWVSNGGGASSRSKRPKETPPV